MTQRLRWVLLGALAAAVFAGGGAWATTHVFGDGGTLHACAQKIDGQLRLVQGGETCRNSEVAVTWNAQGPAGPPGEDGVLTFGGLQGTACTTPFGEGVTWIVNDTGFVHTTEMTARCVAPDASEPNDTRAAATAWPSQGERTIYPAGDDDWYVATGSLWGGLSITRIAGADVGFEIYVDGELVQQGTNRVDPLGLSGRHTFEAHVTSSGTSLYWADIAVLPF